MMVPKRMIQFVLGDFRKVIKEVEGINFSDIDEASRQLIKLKKRIDYTRLIWRMQRLSKKICAYIEKTGVINWEENLIKKLSKKYSSVEIRGDKIYLEGTEKPLYDFVNEAKINTKKIYPELPTEITDFLGMIDDIYEFVAHIEEAVLLSELYLLVKAMKVFRLPANWEEINSDLENLMKEVKIEDKLELLAKKKIFFETLEPGEFETIVGISQNTFVKIFKDLVDYIIKVSEEIRKLATQ